MEGSETGKAGGAILSKKRGGSRRPAARGASTNKMVLRTEAMRKPRKNSGRAGGPRNLYSKG